MRDQVVGRCSITYSEDLQAPCIHVQWVSQCSVHFACSFAALHCSEPWLMKKAILKRHGLKLEIFTIDLHSNTLHRPGKIQLGGDLEAGAQYSAS